LFGFGELINYGQENDVNRIDVIVLIKKQNYVMKNYKAITANKGDDENPYKITNN